MDLINMPLTVFRLEFCQPDGRWTGPYCAEYMTPEAFEIRDRMLVEHHEHDERRPWPDDQIFLDNPGRNRYVCGTTTYAALQDWFEGYLQEFMKQGGLVGQYSVPQDAIGDIDGRQVIYMQRKAMLVLRAGTHVDPERLVERIHPSKNVI